MKTKLEIINETAEFYNLKNRAVIADGKCRYLTDDGKSCAFGRCCNDPKELRAFEGYSINKILENNKLDDFLKDEYKGHEDAFWKSLQTLHDNEGFWDDYGLNYTGINQKQNLINYFG
jgi:hypothetical protein